jgi:hypothetical protein
VCLVEACLDMRVAERLICPGAVAVERVQRQQEATSLGRTELVGVFTDAHHTFDGQEDLIAVGGRDGHRRIAIGGAGGSAR